MYWQSRIPKGQGHFAGPMQEVASENNKTCATLFIASIGLLLLTRKRPPASRRDGVDLGQCAFTGIDVNACLEPALLVSEGKVVA